VQYRFGEFLATETRSATMRRGKRSSVMSKRFAASVVLAGFLFAPAHAFAQARAEAPPAAQGLKAIGQPGPAGDHSF
jgi:hypothetical protein